MPKFSDKVIVAIPSHVYMFSSSADDQQSNEAHNAKGFELPNPNGKAGGACTSALLQVLYEKGHEMGKMSWIDVLKDMRQILKDQGFNQHPQLSCSRWIDVNAPMNIVPKASGRRRAIVIGINYVGQKGELSACHNDCSNVRDYLMEAQGFHPDEILVMMDDGKHTMPTKKNIEDAMERMTLYAQPGDVNFMSFSGHGGNVVDTSGDEDDGFDETIIPVDFATNGQIVDDNILRDFVKPMKKGVHTVVLMDCCHSGTVLDLPYYFSTKDMQMHIEKGFQFEDPPEQAQEKKKKRRHQKKGDESDSDSSVDEGPLTPPAILARGPPQKSKPKSSRSAAPPPPPPLPAQGCCTIS